MMNDLPRPLHLALDASPLQERRPTGVARMVRGWVEALLEVHHPLRVTLFLSGDAPLELEHPHAEILELDTGPQYRLVQLPQALKRVRPHLFHSPFMAIPPGSPVPVVATVHEVPSAGSIVAEGVFRTIRQCVWWSIARRRAQGLASISLHTARAARGAGWQGKPFGVIHPCITSCKETGMPFPRRGPVLAVGTLRRKKGVHLGVAGYLRAVNGLSPRHRPDLIWIGTGEPTEVQVPGVRFPGYLPDAEVQSLMKEAS